MKHVFARISIGFAVRPNSPYMSAWSQQDRSDFKQKVTNTIHAGIPLAYRDRWLNVLFETDDEGHAQEADVHAAIRAELDALNSDTLAGNPEVQFSLKQADPDVVDYYYVDEVRICTHHYVVQTMPKNGDPAKDLEDWKVSLTPVGQSSVVVGLRVSLAWTTHVGQP